MANQGGLPPSAVPVEQQQLQSQSQQQFQTLPPPQQTMVPTYGHLQQPIPPQQPPSTTAGMPPPAHPPPPLQQRPSPAGAAVMPSPPLALKPRKVHPLEERPLNTSGAPDQETEDGRVSNESAYRMIRDDWIYKQVRARQDEFTQYRKATLFVGTWNVNAKGKEEPLDSWLCADWARTGTPDVVAVGFQEIVDLNAVNVAVDNKTQQRSVFWVERLQRTLATNSRDGYVLLSQKSMVGLLICVFVKASHQSRVQYVGSASVGVGVMGMLGNKGGVSIRLQFYDSTLCFVCSHLAAHRENVAGRNADYANVYQKTIFEIGGDTIRDAIRSGGMSNWLIGSSSVKIQDHDIVIWLGDLNYRIDESMATERVLQLSEKGVLEDLRRLDQLNRQRAAKKCFLDFEEGTLNFVPTYKYQPGTDVFDKRPEKKLRAPAWCDRILWMAADRAHVQQISYDRSESPNVSDHKPVYSTMCITTKDVIKEKREAIYRELTDRLDRFDNSTMPLARLDRDTLDFGEVRYGQSVTLPIKIANTGSVLAEYHFVPKPSEASVCKPWLKPSPMFGLIVPGDEPATMEFTLTIDNHTAQMLNSGREVLDDILMLRIENGRDVYISIKATFARSCFAMPADELVMYTEPLRTIPIDPIERVKEVDPTTRTALCVPKELWRLIDAITEKGLPTPNLFIDPGIREEVIQTRECLDTGARFGHFSIHSYAETLIAFLSSLSSPIVPVQLFPAVEIDSQNIQASARRVLEELPPIHYNVFVYVISFFREVLVHRERNLLSPAKVARLCCACLAPGLGLDNSSASLQKQTGMQLIMLHLLETSSI